MFSEEEKNVILKAKTKAMMRVNYFIENYAGNISEADLRMGNILFTGPFFTDNVRAEAYFHDSQRDSGSLILGSGPILLFYSTKTFPKGITLKKGNRLEANYGDPKLVNMVERCLTGFMLEEQRVDRMFSGSLELEWFLVPVPYGMHQLIKMMAVPYIWQAKFHISLAMYEELL